MSLDWRRRIGDAGAGHAGRGGRGGRGARAATGLRPPAAGRRQTMAAGTALLALEPLRTQRSNSLLVLTHTYNLEIRMFVRTRYHMDLCSGAFYVCDVVVLSPQGSLNLWFLLFRLLH